MPMPAERARFSTSRYPTDAFELVQGQRKLLCGHLRRSMKVQVLSRTQITTTDVSIVSTPQNGSTDYESRANALA
jgi:hypothetical protein